MVRGTMVPLPFKRERRYIMKYGTKNKVHEKRAAFLFILPAVVLLAAFLILPAVSTVRYAFTDYNILRPDKIKFCGLDNFVSCLGTGTLRNPWLIPFTLRWWWFPSSAFWPCF